jgi:RHS repeat-associated protein
LGSETSRSESKRFTSYDRSVRTGLDYAINRTYDSKLGRFTQVDPIKMAATNLTDPQSFNLYNYCGNDPINYTDPSGLFFGKLFKWLSKALKWIAIAVTVAVIVLSIAASHGTLAPWLASILKGLTAFLAKIGSIMKFASGGFIVAEGNIALAGVGLGGLWGINAAVGAIASAFTNGEVELTGEARKQYDAAVTRLLVLLNDKKSKCYKFLKKKGFNPDKIAKDLGVQKPFDGFLSTNSEDLGALGATPKEFFETLDKNSIPTDAVTAGLGGNIYYGKARGGIKPSLVLHESLHRNFPNSPRSKKAITDDKLGRRLGAKNTGDTEEINKRLEAKGCK